MAEAQQWAKRVHKYGIAVLKLDRLMGVTLGEEGPMREIKVIKRDGGKAPFLVVVKGRLEGKKVVGFASALDPSEALRLAIEKYDNNSMRLREDRPYVPPDAGGE